MSKKLVGGTLGSVLASHAFVENGMIKVHSKLVGIYPKIELQAVAVHESNKNHNHFMLESVVETAESYVYVCSRYIMDLDGEKTLRKSIEDFIQLFNQQCELIKNNYKE